ncbi:MAG: HAD family phosphatase [Patescibacteria group bacterium]|nr:HAD family phosphatase [Patescibacteria group bacterium]
MAKKRKIAAFDIDGTVFRASLLLELVDGLIDAGAFPVKTQKEFEREHERWLDRKGRYEDYIDKVVRVFARRVKGMPLTVGQKVARRIIAEKKDRTYRYTRDLVKKLRRQGYFLVAISHSPKFIVGPYGRKLGFGKVYGSIYGTDDHGRFTGRVDYADMIQDKAAMFRHVMEKWNGDPKMSIAVGDTESDIPMLRLAAKPLAFNPNKKLYQYAKKHGWKVVVERKDVMYEI